MEYRQYIDFLHKIEKLKCHTRHSWNSEGKRESVAEHCWMMTLMAFFMKDEFPEVDMNKVHLVEFCWYNCSEAPDYYSMDKGKDPFYEEVPFICNFTLD